MTTEMKTEKATFHIYAVSMLQYAKTTDTRDLSQLIKLMDADDAAYNLFYVPVPHDTPYEINFFQPQVEGAVFIGHMPRKAKKGVRK